MLGFNTILFLNFVCLLISLFSVFLLSFGLFGHVKKIYFDSSVSLCIAFLVVTLDITLYIHYLLKSLIGYGKELHIFKCI